MDPLDKLLTNYVAEAERAAAPAYDQARELIHKRMRIRSAILWGGSLGGIAIVSLGLWLVLSAGFDYARVIPAENEGIVVTQDVGSANNPPAIVLAPSTDGGIVKKDGRKEPIRMYVNHNDDAIDRLVADGVSVASLAQSKGDLKKAALVYLELAKTLELHDQTDKVLWATGKALEFANSISDPSLAAEIATIRDRNKGR